MAVIGLSREKFRDCLQIAENWRRFSTQGFFQYPLEGYAIQETPNAKAQRVHR
jgi:hypothetical protein